ncbi:hypothetical protein D7Z26_14795 [Cohnella endophytica]|uniref:Uncharacterized protein n=1 Tax=Cohnella endophytica TaxID=2419778 RepID=A0A494XVN1_9BACL|nr:DUF6171 family protein [Cohnella endophytica]RKP53006.1 hypothetical protein D7Z26_14795 [Cohnella endophytica]
MAAISGEAHETNCKGCSASVRLSPEEIVKLFGDTVRVKEVKLATESEYERRMAQCRKCEAFQFGTTCRWCGCLMDIKAKLEKSSCPSPGGSLW